MVVNVLSLCMARLQIQSLTVRKALQTIVRHSCMSTAKANRAAPAYQPMGVDDQRDAVQVVLGNLGSLRGKKDDSVSTSDEKLGSHICMHTRAS